MVANLMRSDRQKIVLFLVIAVPVFCGAVGCRSHSGYRDSPVDSQVFSQNETALQNEAASQNETALQKENAAAGNVVAVNHTILQPQTGKPLLLDDVTKLALENHPALSAAAARMHAAQGQQIQAGLLPNPVIGYHATQLGNRTTARQHGGFIGQKIITGKKLQFDEAIAQKGFEHSSFQFDAQEQRVLTDVQLRFYDALVAQRRIKLAQRLAAISDALVESGKTLLAAKQISENDQLQAEIEAEQSQILLDDARHQQREVWQRFAAVVGVTTLTVQPLVGELDATIRYAGWDDCYAAILNNSPELQAAQSRVEQSRLKIPRARRENIPNVDVMLSVRHSRIHNSEVANLQVGMPIPVFNRNQGNILRAQAELIAAQNDYHRMELNLKDRLAVVHRQYLNARQQVERYQHKILPRSKKSLDLVTTGYKKGQVKYLTLITSQRTFIRVNLAYLDALQKLRRAVTMIDGQLLSGSLSSR